MSGRKCALPWCPNPLYSRGLCDAHYTSATRDYGRGIRGPVTMEARAALLPSGQCHEELWTCGCAHPLDVSPVGECMRCRRPVITAERVAELRERGYLT